MPPAKRPPAKEKAGLKAAIRVNGTIHVVRFNEISGLDAAALRAAIGMGVPQLAQAAKDAPDLDIVAGLVFLSRRQAGEQVTYDDIAASMTYGNSVIEEVKAKDIPAELLDPQT